MKTASDLAIWNEDFLKNFNLCITNMSGHGMISLQAMNELERQHLEYLNFFIGFGTKSKKDERILNIMSFIDLKSIHLIEKELLSLEYTGDGVMIGSVIQKAMFKKNSETPICFFRKGSTQSKNDDDIPCKNKEESPRNELRKSV
jgi:hypothetical protein